ncbi:MAG: AtpZ/AtpI family protein [Gemmatimonadaceae bacterium]|jgi:F0F1-type ATP synthase assembly protein I|nr:AtpZ/AtpI family protein [Gemmatimonadaceae bacterium]
MAPSSGSGALRLAAAGVQLAATLVAGLYGGQWLDRRFGSEPVFLYVGVALGAIGGMMALYRQLMAAVRDEEAARRGRRPGNDE